MANNIDFPYSLNSLFVPGHSEHSWEYTIELV